VRFFISHLLAMRAGTGEPLPARIRSLVPGIYPAHLTRVRDDQLAVHVEGGMLPKTGTWPGASGEAPAWKLEYMGQLLGNFVRGVDDPLHAGDVIALEGFRVEVGAVAGDGGPSDMTFTFDRSLDDPSLRWLVWRDDGYAPFAVPPVGGQVDLAPTPMRP
jgi:hypothetical protein